MEDERWRAGLTDDEAKVLLDWGIAQVKRLFKDTQAQPVCLDEQTEEEAEQAKLRHLRGAMRSIAYLVTEEKPFTADQLLEELEPYLPIPAGYKKIFIILAGRRIANQIAQASEQLGNEELICRLATFVETAD